MEKIKKYITVNDKIDSIKLGKVISMTFCIVAGVYMVYVEFKLFVICITLSYLLKDAYYTFKDIFFDNNVKKTIKDKLNNFLEEKEEV